MTWMWFWSPVLLLSILTNLHARYMGGAGKAVAATVMLNGIFLLGVLAGRWIWAR